MPRVKTVTAAQRLTATRGTTHGPFEAVATASLALEGVMFRTPNWITLSPVRKMVVKEICHKLARIGSGDPAHPDHWDDIGGYLELGKNDGQAPKPVRLAQARPRKAAKKVAARPAKKAARVAKRPARVAARVARSVKKKRVRVRAARPAPVPSVPAAA